MLQLMLEDRATLRTLNVEFHHCCAKTSPGRKSAEQGPLDALRPQRFLLLIRLPTNPGTETA